MIGLQRAIGSVGVGSQRQRLKRHWSPHWLRRTAGEKSQWRRGSRNGIRSSAQVFHSGEYHASPLPHPHAMALADFSTCAFVPRATRHSKLSSRRSLTLLSSAPRPHVAVCHNYQHPLGRGYSWKSFHILTPQEASRSWSYFRSQQSALRAGNFQTTRNICSQGNTHLYRKGKGSAMKRHACPFFPRNPAT